MLGAARLAQGQYTSDDGMQVLTRGPIHEAFAEAAMTGAVAGVVVKRVPPDPIAELPPVQRPEGYNVAWIPGYWSWDDDRNDFIWVSGVWRDLPPGRQWVPGYWTPAGRGAQWISGYWANAAQTEVSYLPAPPKSYESGPSSPSPGPNTIWSPGCWIWQQSGYAWQPGYWVAQQPDWVWSPAHYTWTPRGYVYVGGYWDHDIVHRGVMFAPIHYNRPVYTRPNYSYSPSTVIDLLVVAAALFVQPRTNHYYYSDYYDSRYERRGIYPWYSKQATRYGEDPLYAHYRSTQLRRDPDWVNHMAEQYRYRRDHVDARPPQTLAHQINIINNLKAKAPRDFVIGRHLADFIQSKTLPLRFTPVNVDERKQIERRGQEVNRFQLERRRLESAPVASGRTKAPPKTTQQPVRLRMPASPVAARPIQNVQGVKAPPPIPVAPKPQAIDRRGRPMKPQKVEAQPNVQPRPQRTETPQQMKPQRVESKPEVRSQQQPEPKAQSPRSDTNNRSDKHGRAHGKKDNKNKKRNDR